MSVSSNTSSLINPPTYHQQGFPPNVPPSTMQQQIVYTSGAESYPAQPMPPQPQYYYAQPTGYAQLPVILNTGIYLEHKGDGQLKTENSHARQNQQNGCNRERVK